MSADESIIAAYKITDTQTDRFYVGSTSNLERRLQEHKLRLQAGRHPNTKMQEGFTHWDNVEVEYIQVDTPEKSKVLEQSLLRFNKNDPDCANIGTGSISLWSDGMPEEIREKIGNAHRGRPKSEETKRRLSVAALKRPPMSDETKSKIGAASKGRVFSDDHKDRIRQAALNRGPRAESDIVNRQVVIIDGAEYPSIRAAANSLGVSETVVRYRTSLDTYPTWRRA